MTKPTAEELEQLTDEERAGLAEEHGDEETTEEEAEKPAGEGEAAATAAAAAADPKKEGETGLEDDPAKAAAVDPEKVVAPAVAPVATPAKDPRDPAESMRAAQLDMAAGPEREKPAAPAPVAHAVSDWRPPEKAQERLDDLAQQRRQLAEKFDEGEVTGVEYREQMETLEEQQRELREGILKASINRETAEAYWGQVTVATFLASHPGYVPGTPAHAALDLEVRKLQVETNNPFDPNILEKAHANIEASARVLLGLPAKPTKDEPKPGAAKVKPGGPVIPPTLGGLPAADIEEVDDGGGFAALDRLTGVAYEKALAAMPEADRERYLAR